MEYGDGQYSSQTPFGLCVGQGMDVILGGRLGWLLMYAGPDVLHRHPRRQPGAEDSGRPESQAGGAGSPEDPSRAGRRRYVAQRNISFDKWGEAWLDSLERKRTTVRSYEPTIGYGRELFGKKDVRRIRVDDISRYNRVLKDRGMTASTRAKHLRVLGACLQAAVRHEYAAAIPSATSARQSARTPNGKRPHTSQTTRSRGSSRRSLTGSTGRSFSSR